MVVTDYAAIKSQIDEVDFGNIEVNVFTLAELFQPYLIFGSKRFNLSLTDVTVYGNRTFAYSGKDEKNVQVINGVDIPTTLNGLLANGVKFLDAVTWISIPPAKRPAAITIDDTEKSMKTFKDPAEIARCMFYYFFYVLTRARAPGPDDLKEGQKVPDFLKKVLSIDKNPAQVADYLASFALNLLDHGWVQHVKLNSLSGESLNRFGLGVAGYRMAAPFKLFTPEGQLQVERLAAIRVAKSFATSEASWEIHPSTRDPNILTKYGNLNKNLGNLMLDVFTKEQLDQMVKARIIFAVPTREPSHTNYITWSDSDIYVPKKKIFRK